MRETSQSSPNKRYNSGQEFDAFLSYASNPDNKLARKTEAFLERVHLLDRPDQRERTALRVCLDGSDFDLNKEVERSANDTPVQTILQSYLNKSASLIVMCSPGAVASEDVAWEVKWFRENCPERPIHVVVTEGSDPLDCPEKIFPEPIIKEELHRQIWFDFRGSEKRRSRGISGVRDYDESRLQLAAALYNDGTTRGDLAPGWYRQKQQENRRRLIFISVAGLIMTVLAVLATVQSYQEKTQRLMAEVASFDAQAENAFSESRLAATHERATQARVRELRNEVGKLQEAANLSQNRVNVLSDEIDTELSELRKYAEHRRQAFGKGVNSVQSADQIWEKSSDRFFSKSARNRPVPPQVFSIEMLDAHSGEGTLIHYGPLDHPYLIVLDGAGHPKGWSKYLRPRLVEISQHRNDDSPLAIQAIIASQWDMGRLGGLTELAREGLDSSSPSYLPMTIGRIWFNAPRPFDGSYHKFQLAILAEKLGVALNSPFDSFVARPDDGIPVVELPGGLKILVLNPSIEALREFKDVVSKQMPHNGKNSFFSEIPQEVTGDFEIRPQKSVKRKLAYKLNGRDSSVSNRASMVLVFEFDGKSFLYSGDVNDIQIAEGLALAGLLTEDGHARFDVIHIPHYGSDRNVSPGFFKGVVANNYLITGDGRHGNPEPETLTMLLDARTGENFSLHFAHREGNSGSLGSDLDELFISRRANSNDVYRRVFRQPESPSIVIDLIEPISW